MELMNRRCIYQLSVRPTLTETSIGKNAIYCNVVFPRLPLLVPCYYCGLLVNQYLESLPVRFFCLF